MENKIAKEKIDDKHFLFGMLNVLANRLQTVGDAFFEEISWKQWFVLIGIQLYETPPTINEVADVIGSSHQNVKQILLKLAKVGFVELYTDEKDRRKTRIKLTNRVRELDSKYSKDSMIFMEALYKGLDDKDIAITMKTLSMMDQNLVSMREENLQKR